MSGNAFNTFAPQPLKAMQVLFSPMASPWAGEKSLGCISETMRLLGVFGTSVRDVGVQHHSLTIGFCSDLDFEELVRAVSWKP